MCGIAFHYHRSMDAEEARLRLAEAVRLMYPRGPDAQGIQQMGAAGFGHVRLSIIDLSGSVQPMSSADGNYCLVFNGEIYNYRHIRDSLEARWQFRTGGDTEVLLAGLVLEGAGFLSRLEGL